MEEKEQRTKKPKLSALALETVSKMPLFGKNGYDQWLKFAADIEENVRLRLLQTAYGSKIDFSGDLQTSTEKLDAHIQSVCNLEAESQLAGTLDNVEFPEQMVSRRQIELVRNSERLIETLANSFGSKRL